MTGIYSVTFMAIAGGSQYFTVPSGAVAVIKGIDVSFPAGTPASFEATLAESGCYFWSCAYGGDEGVNNFQYRGALAVEAGDSMVGIAASGAPNWAMWGYLFE